MPVVDFDADPAWNPGHHDVAIIGAGAAGLYLASLLSRRFRVVVLESGGFTVEPQAQELNQVESTGKRLRSAVDGRKRTIGGTTIAWGGQSLPFSPIDFEERSWVPRSGWPFDETTLATHYANANRTMGVDELNYDDDIFRLLRITPPSFDRDLIRFHFSKWAPNPRFREIFSRQIATAFTVVSHCTVTDIEPEGSNVRAVVGRNRSGSSQRFPCARLIIAGGGLESTRLLLWLQANHGFLNPGQAARLGSGFMEHPCIDAGVVHHERPYQFQKRFNTQFHRRRKYSLRLSASETWQRRHQFLNATAAVTMKLPGDAFDPYGEFRTFAKLWARRGRLVRAADRLCATALALAWDRFVFKKGAIATLGLCVEEPPATASVLRLGDSSDHFGIPKLSVNWQMSRATWDTAVAFAAVVRAEIERLSLGKVALRPELLEPDQPRYDLFWDIGHHMGGTALGVRVNESVVDPDLQIRGLSNAWVCSGSVFPTGSHSNPTLTVLALADRLAHKLSHNGITPLGTGVP